MCVEVRLEVTGLKEKQLDKLTTEIEIDVNLWFCGYESPKGTKTFTRMISEPEMCGCTLIDGDVDPKGLTGSFEQMSSPRLLR